MNHICHEKKNDPIESIIANNNRRAAVSLEHGGLKYLTMYSIFNNPKTTGMYIEKKDTLSQQLNDEIKNHCRFGLIGTGGITDQLRKDVNGIPAEDLYKLRII